MVLGTWVPRSWFLEWFDHQHRGWPYKYQRTALSRIIMDPPRSLRITFFTMTRRQVVARGRINFHTSCIASYSVSSCTTRIANVQCFNLIKNRTASGMVIFARQINKGDPEPKILKHEPPGDWLVVGISMLYHQLLFKTIFSVYTNKQTMTSKI